MIPKTMEEMAHDLAIMDERLRNIEKRFTNYEHRTLPHLQTILEPREVIVKNCPNDCGAPIMDKQGAKLSCGKCGYKNFLE